MNVSVLIPVYNSQTTIGAAIESVLNQTYQDFEIIVVDDGSTDGTAEIVKKYTSVKYFYQQHSGVCFARNFALTKAKGELIMWLDSDDLYKPEKIEKQVSFMDRHKDCNIVFCSISSFSDKEFEKLNSRQQKIYNYAKNQRNYLTAACIRKKLYEKYGGYDTALNYFEDTAWTFLIQLKGENLNWFMKDCLYLRRVHDGELSLQHKPVGHKGILRFYSSVIRRKLTKE